ncbi:6-phosphogluconolactonase [Sideroxyarcus emersonii]|uniref:6-phosphogluconolactonase n=1 Tax=Sideroxyarcus emersonii TaxID=2764705 RepID=A0AAN1XBA2_9PROT|nr:6-phosphogluconolactonase [Sideroxyarcus emersonii]BCK87977.1 6-phosphogluconolactonase [Sideroxyarcus emersonii]
MMNSFADSFRGVSDVKAMIVHRNADELADAVAQRIAVLAADAIAMRGVFRVVLAGGQTPRGYYRRLPDMPVDWNNVHVYFSDERCLPLGDAQRNDSMVQQALLDRIDLPFRNIHAIHAELGARLAAADYAARLAHAMPFDLVLLGMGEDGHTASLFPGNPAMQLTDVAVPVYGAPKLPAERVSLGINTLNAARNKLFAVTGAGKSEALWRIARGDQLPAAMVKMAEWHVELAALTDAQIERSA